MSNLTFPLPPLSDPQMSVSPAASRNSPSPVPSAAAPTTPSNATSSAYTFSPPPATGAGAAMTKAGVKLFLSHDAFAAADRDRFWALLKSGITLRKYGRSGKPHPTLVGAASV